jgi:hypothetical protein
MSDTLVARLRSIDVPARLAACETRLARAKMVDSVTLELSRAWDEHMIQYPFTLSVASREQYYGLAVLPIVQRYDAPINRWFGGSVDAKFDEYARRVLGSLDRVGLGHIEVENFTTDGICNHRNFLTKKMVRALVPLANKCDPFLRNLYEDIRIGAIPRLLMESI